MTTSPLTLNIRVTPTATPATSPASMVLVVPKDAGVPGAINVLTNVSTDAQADAFLGAGATTARRHRNAIEAAANVHLGAVLYTPSATPATEDTNINAALDILTNEANLSVLGGSIDAIIVVSGTGRTTGASSVVTKLASVCAHDSVHARGIVVGFTGAGVTQAQAGDWLDDNAGERVLCITNNATYNGQVAENGAVVAAAHIARYMAIEGIGAHPFALNDPMLGVSVPVPQWDFGLTDGSQPANALAAKFGTSIIDYQGTEYLWGGQLKTSVASDPRRDFANALVFDRIVKRTRQLVAPHIGDRATPSLRIALGVLVHDHILEEFGDFIDDVPRVEASYPASNQLSLEMDIDFHGFIASVALNFNLTY